MPISPIPPAPLPSGLRPFLPWQVPAFEFAKFRDRIGFVLDKRLGKCTLAIRWALARHCKDILVVSPLSAVPGWLNDLETEGQYSFLAHGDKRDEGFLEIWNTLRTPREMHPVNVTPAFFVTNSQSLFKPTGRKKVCPDCRGVGSFIDVLAHQACPSHISPIPCIPCMGTGKVAGSPIPEPTPIALAPWDCVIWDESYLLQNPESQTNQIANLYLSNARCKAILTGEIAPEGDQNIFEQMKWCFGVFMGARNIWQWRNKHFKKIGYDWMPKAGVKREIKEALHARCVVMSRKQAGIGEVFYTDRRYCDLSQKVRRAYELVEKYWQWPAEEDVLELPKMTKYAFVVQNWLAQIAGGCAIQADFRGDHKINLLVEILSRDYATDPVVVSFRFNSEIKAAQQALAAHNIVFDTLTGAVPPVARRELGKRFSTGKFRVLLGQVKVLKYGIDLSVADTMIRYSLPTAYDDISQSRDRIIHPLKKRPLMYIDLITRDTIDEDMVQLIGEKRADARYFMNELTKRIMARRTA